MHTVRGTSRMRPARSIAIPGVTWISSCDESSQSGAPAQVQAAGLKPVVDGPLPPSPVVPPVAVFHKGSAAPVVTAEVSTCRLPFLSMIADRRLNFLLG